ncbi:sulfurtransferase [Mesorhizobium sp. DCY119]|uniref:sulfurtransferase n=1 Tax=Mesorhizobium sp. DCY119 TaxID=2108445 RepID=UPI0013C3F22F|nr:sulfurtransferase [Mesorhizobium sp. DCY119]
MTHEPDPPLARTVTPAWLSEALQSGGDFVVLDVRFSPGQPGRRESFLAGHVPGARYIDLPTELADPVARQKGRGSNPLPQPDHLQQTLRRLGVSATATVIAYDDTNGAPAARAWWVLVWAGLADVRVLEGGLKAWVAEGGLLAKGEANVEEPGNVELAPGRLPHVDVDAVLQVANHATLVDARPADNFAGPTGGHIPGARSFPANQVLDAHGRFIEAEVLRDRLSAAGIDPDRPIVAYCGGGVAASLLTFGLDRIGADVTFYPGSWSEWRLDPARPVES